MAHFAKLDENGVVLEVVVVNNNDAPDEASGIAFLGNLFGDGIVWKQTSYHGNIRKNYAGIGYSYDELRDAFIPPQPYPSWLLNEQTCLWESPTPMPTDDKRYQWDEDAKAWVEA
jgi:hypothetical protein